MIEPVRDLIAICLNISDNSQSAEVSLDTPLRNPIFKPHLPPSPKLPGMFPPSIPPSRLESVGPIYTHTLLSHPESPPNQRHTLRANRSSSVSSRAQQHLNKNRSGGLYRLCKILMGVASQLSGRYSISITRSTVALSGSLKIWRIGCVILGLAKKI